MVNSFASGVYTVLTTPFTEDNKVDVDSLSRWVELQCASDVAGLVLLGTTSEAPTLSEEEMLHLTATVKELVKDRKPIIIGVGGNNTQATLNFAQKTYRYADGFMVTAPAYNKPSQRGIVAHFQAICQDEIVNKKPVLVYNIPSRTGVNIEPKTLLEIYNTCKNVKGVKEASGSLPQAMTIADLCDIDIFSGDDALTLPILAIGGKGVISVASNAIPNEVTNLVNTCLLGDFKQGKRLFFESNLKRFYSAIFCETNPVPIKYIMYKLGVFTTPLVRLPMVLLVKDSEDLVWDAYQNVVKVTKKKSAEETVTRVHGTEMADAIAAAQ